MNDSFHFLESKQQIPFPQQAFYLCPSRIFSSKYVVVFFNFLKILSFLVDTLVLGNLMYILLVFQNTCLGLSKRYRYC